MILSTYTPYANMPNIQSKPSAQSINHDNDTRLQALALAEAEIAFKIITAMTEISR